MTLQSLLTDVTYARKQLEGINEARFTLLTLDRVGRALDALERVEQSLTEEQARLDAYMDGEGGAA